MTSWSWRSNSASSRAISGQQTILPRAVRDSQPADRPAPLLSPLRQKDKSFRPLADQTREQSLHILAQVDGPLRLARLPGRFVGDEQDALPVFRNPTRIARNAGIAAFSSWSRNSAAARLCQAST